MGDLIAFVYSKTGQSNPGNITIQGMFVNRNGDILLKFCEAAGEGSNIQASYLSILQAVQLAKNLKPGKLFVAASDSLVIDQLNNECATKKQNLIELKYKINEAVSSIGCNVDFKWIAKHKMPVFK